MAKMFDVNRKSRDKKSIKCLLCGNTAETVDECGQPLCYDCYLEQHPEYEEFGEY